MSNEVQQEQYEKEVGSVRWFDNAKGFGFIDSDDGTTDIFVHYRSIMMGGYKVLGESQRVSYMRVKSEKGWSAVEVTPLTD